MQPSYIPDDVPRYKKTTREINQIVHAIHERRTNCTHQPTNSDPNKEKRQNLVGIKQHEFIKKAKEKLQCH